MTNTSPTSAQPTISIVPLSQGVSSACGTLDVMVRVAAPAQPATTAVRPALRLALVVDRSGSMSGKPLEEAKRCVEHIVTRLQPSDSVAVVAYDNEVQTPLPLQSALANQAVLSAIREMGGGGSTDLFAGWEAGAKQLEAGQANAVSRVILLSDGQANAGLTHAEQIFKHCGEWLTKGVTTTTVGLGRGFNEDLMVGMATAGGGQHYYGESAEDLYDGFDEELSLLKALCLRRLRIKPIAAPGVIAEPLGLVTRTAEGWVSLSDLAWGSEAFLMLRLHVSTQSSGEMTLLAFTLEASDEQGQTVTLHASPLVLPVVSPQAFLQLPVDETVQSRLREVEFAELSARARRMVREGQIREARDLLNQARERFGDQPWIVGKLERLQELLDRDAEFASKEMYYSAMKMSKRLASVDEVRFSADEMDAPEMPAFLRRKLEEGRGRRRS